MSKRVAAILLILSLCHGVFAASESPEHAPANKIPIELHENLAPVLIANVDGIDVRLQFDLGDRTPLVLQQSVLDSIKAVPTGETSKLQGTDGV